MSLTQADVALSSESGSVCALHVLTQTYLVNSENPLRVTRLPRHRRHHTIETIQQGQASAVIMRLRVVPDTPPVSRFPK